MYWGYTYPELFFMMVLTSLVITTLIATINAEVINEKLEGLYNFVDDRFTTSRGWLTRLLLGVFVFPARFFTNLRHEGWKSGFMTGSMFFSLFIFLGVISLLLFITFWIVIIFVALWLLGVLFGGGRRRY